MLVPHHLAPVTRSRFAGVPIGDGDYWIAVHADTELGSRGPDAAVVNIGRRIVSQPYASALPDPFGSTNSYNNTRGMRMRIWTNP